MYGRGNSGGRGQNGSKNYSARTAAGGGGGGASSTVVMAPVKNYQTVPADTGLVGSGGGAMLEGEWSSLNPSLYQNMSNEQVDWAALAQQWIQMKETLPADMVPAAPPPPIISESYGSNSRDSLPDGSHMGSAEEQGEAPMEVERDEDHSAMVHQQQQSANPWDNGSVSWQYPAHNEWRNPAWDSSWSSAVPNADKAYDAVSVAVNPNASLAVANWQAKMARIYKFGDPSNSNAIAGTVQPTGQSSHQQDTMPSSKRIPGLMDQVIKLDHHQDSGEHGDLDDDTTQTINDAKRKLLPAWIREGLEKMEREKQRQAEKEKEQQQRVEMLQQRRQAELEALNELEDAKRKSKFESDSEEDEPRNEDQQDDERQGADSPMPTRSREEILQELMIAVRKNLTEILLEVTNEEIALVAKETLAKTRRKAPTAQALRKTGLATLTGGLGLGIYGDSDDEDESGSDNGDDDDDVGNSEDDEEAEKALKTTIKQRQKEFEWTAREIEEEIAKEEAAEERRKREYEQLMRQKDQQNNVSDEEDYTTGGGGRAGLGHSQAAGTSSGGGKFGPRDGETQPVNDKLYAYKLGRSRDKRVSRFSDPKDTVRQTHITHVAIVNHKPGEAVSSMAVPKAAPIGATSAVVSPPVLDSISTPLFPAAIAAARHLEELRRGSSVASETPSNASSSRASSSRRETESRKTSHKSHKSKKHKRSRHSRSDEEDDDYYDNDDDRYSQHSRRSRSSERSSYSQRRRRSYSRDSRDDDRDRKYSYKSRDRSRSRSRDRYKSSRRRSRSRSRSPSRRRY